MMMEISRPCITVESTIAKSKFDCTFDMNVAIKILERHNIFGEIKYSERLGMLKTYGHMNIILSYNGDIVIKPINSKEEAYLFFKRLGLILLPARICDEEKIALANLRKTICSDGCCVRRIKLKDELDDKP